jgi:hypothetical protein
MSEKKRERRPAKEKQLPTPARADRRSTGRSRPLRAKAVPDGDEPPPGGYAPPHYAAIREDPVRDGAIMYLPLVIEGTPNEAEKALGDAVRGCVEAVVDAHAQMAANRAEVSALGEETRRLLSELKAA